MTEVKSKQTKLLEALQNGAELTSSQITARFNIPNPSATVNDLRRAGWTVNSGQFDTKYGVTNKYYMSKSAARKRA